MQPQGMRRTYSFLCRKFPKIVELLNRRHIDYMKQYNEVFELEKQGKAFVFCPSEFSKVGTYKMDIKENQRLYDSGIVDYNNSMEKLEKFLA